EVPEQNLKLALPILKSENLATKRKSKFFVLTNITLTLHQLDSLAAAVSYS
ncbi:MAG: hypothetical protein ACI82E_001456, partial [Nonlabens sp.]